MSNQTYARLFNLVHFNCIYDWDAGCILTNTTLMTKMYLGFSVRFVGGYASFYLEG